MEASISHITITIHVYNGVFAMFNNGVFASSTVLAAIVAYKWKVMETLKRYKLTTFNLRIQLKNNGRPKNELSEDDRLWLEYFFRDLVLGI